MDTRECLSFLVMFTVWLLFALVLLYLLFGQAKAIYVAATEGLHRRRMEMMDKLIEMERVKATGVGAFKPRTAEGGGQW